MKRPNRKFYKTPECEVQDMECSGFMIEIGSGNTSPEESDANHFVFEEEEENEKIIRTRSIWDD